MELIMKNREGKTKEKNSTYKFYTNGEGRVYVYDYDSGFYKMFDEEKGEWVTPVNSFMQTEADYDTDFVEITKTQAESIARGANFEDINKKYNEHLQMLGRGE